MYSKRFTVQSLRICRTGLFQQAHKLLLEPEFMQRPASTGIPLPLGIVPAFSGNTSSDIYCNRFVYDALDGRYRYFTISVDESLKPSDPPPSSVPRRHMNNIMNYCVSLSRNSQASFLAKCNWNQPVFRAELVRLRRNLLNRMTGQEKETKTGCFVCLEPLKISKVSCPELL